MPPRDAPLCVRTSKNSGDIVSLDTVRAVVLAAGRGVRMKSEKAKVLHELLGRPLIHHVLRSLRSAGVKDIVVVVGHQEDAVKKAAGPGVTFARQTEQKGTGHAVLSAEKAVKGRDGLILVLAGDAPLITPDTIKAMIAAHREAGAGATVLTCCIDDPSGYGRITRDESGKFLGIVEHNDATEKQKEISEVNSGAYVFDAKDLFRALKEVKVNPKKGEIYPDRRPAGPHEPPARGRHAPGVRPRGGLRHQLAARSRRRHQLPPVAHPRAPHGQRRHDRRSVHHVH